MLEGTQRSNVRNLVRSWTLSTGHHAENLATNGRAEWWVGGIIGQDGADRDRLGKEGRGGKRRRGMLARIAEEFDQDRSGGAAHSNSQKQRRLNAEGEDTKRYAG